MGLLVYILGKFSVCGGAPTINAKNFSSLAFLLGHKRSLCPFLLYYETQKNTVLHTMLIHGKEASSQKQEI